MKQKTTKLKKLESERFSIMTDDLTKCYICGSTPVEIHEIYAGANRKQSMKHGFCIPLCSKHHVFVQLNRYQLARTIKKMCQIKFEEQNSHKEFMDIIGKSYL